MKAHEETWARDRKGDLRTPDGCFAIGLVDQASDADDGNMARLQLAACAPEMARMLAEIHDFNCHGKTPRCCAIGALLRKAGVRDQTAGSTSDPSGNSSGSSSPG